MKTSDKKRFEIFGHTVMILLTLIAILPMILLLMSSLSDNDSLIKYGYSFFPKKFSLAAYEYIFTAGTTVLRAYGMSFAVTIIGTCCALVLTTLLGYALSKKFLPGRNLLTFLVFFTMLFHGGLVPTYLNYTNVFGIKNTIWALIIPSLMMSAYNVLLVKSYFVTGVPEEIMEAAEIDGASEFSIFAKVALPLAKPIVATIGLFAGINYWNDWNNGYIYLTRRTDLYTIQNLLNRMVKNMEALANSTETSAAEAMATMPTVAVRMAIAVVGVLPIVIIYPFIQNNFVKGITLGGVKG